MASPLLEAGAIDGARGILINITGSSNLKLSEVNEASSIIQNAAHEDANIIFGAVLDENMGDEIKITVIATGFRQDELPRLRDRAQADPSQPVGRRDVPIQRYSIPKAPVARFASETADELDVKPAGSPTQAPAPAAEPPAVPEERQRTAPSSTDTLIPVRASVFDDDFFRSAQEADSSRPEPGREREPFTAASPFSAPRTEAHDFRLTVDVQPVAPKTTPSWEPTVAEPIVRNPSFAVATTVEVEQRESEELDIPAFLRRSN
jgi:cell division protein FtsZ